MTRIQRHRADPELHEGPCSNAIERVGQLEHPVDRRAALRSYARRRFSLVFSRFFISPLVLDRPAEATIDSIHALNPGVLFSPEKGRAWLALPEPSEGNF